MSAGGSESISNGSRILKQDDSNLTSLAPAYSPKAEAKRILHVLCELKEELHLPRNLAELMKSIEFTSQYDTIYFPIPFKETETVAALKGLEALVVVALANLKYGERTRKVEVNLERTTCFLFQTYLSTIGGLGKYDVGVKARLKDTDLFEAQSDPYRRMSANLYATKTPNTYFHIHGSLEASTTLNMIGLPPYRRDLKTINEISDCIESHVQEFTLEELEAKNKDLRQAGVPALKYEEFVSMPHGKTNVELPPWSVTPLEKSTPPVSLPHDAPGEKPRVLSGIKILELCRVIAGPVITRILAEYGADVLKVTSPNLPDVPFFQVDVNMGKHCTDIDLKSADGREVFENLLLEADIVVDGYRPGSLEKLGYGPSALKELALKRNKGYVYVNENCFGYEGEWAYRAGWQQIADCATGIAWAQGKFMGLDEPVVPPFPISDYGTGAMGAIAALTGLYHRASSGGSWHAQVSLMHYDLFLFRMGQYSDIIQAQLRHRQWKAFFELRHNHSVDQVSGTVMKQMRLQYPWLFDPERYRERWESKQWKAEVSVVKPVAEIEGLKVEFRRASRPNGSDKPEWIFPDDEDTRLL
ncbi:CAIB/BAIF family protein [Bisporella sp. PMI_857]|nr:CAIB/BAIF family protein [Bisporella sp. PMI_857]